MKLRKLRSQNLAVHLVVLIVEPFELADSPVPDLISFFFFWNRATLDNQVPEVHLD